MYPQRRGTFARRRNVHRLFLCLLAIALLGPVGCQSSGGTSQRWFHWPWKKKENPGPLGSGPANPDVDPFLPPPRAGAQGKEESLSRRARRDDPVVRLQTPQEAGISLVSAEESASADEAASNLDSILHPLAAKRDYQYIVVHHSHSEAGNLDEIDRLHRQTLGWEGCGFHFVIGNGHGSDDGEIEVSQRWKLQKHGAHLSTQAPAAYNLRGIGVCLVGDFTTQRPTDRQLAAARRLVQYLMYAYDIPAYRVVTHGEVTSDGLHGDCPGPLFRISDILADRD
jgi:hypothetical protein